MKFLVAVKHQSQILNLQSTTDTRHFKPGVRFQISGVRSLSPVPWPLAPVLTAFCLLSCVLPFLSPGPCPLSPALVFAAGGRYEVREIKPHIFVWIPEDILEQDADPQFSRAGNAGFIITSEGVIVVDTTNSPFHARELLYEIRHRTDEPVKHVVNTNSSGDQMLGNEVFLDLQASILSTSVAQAAIRQYEQELSQRLGADPRLQARMRGIHVTLSTQTFDREMRLLVGGQEIKVLRLNAGESAGDAAVYLPAAKVLFLGNLFENGYFPGLESRDVRGWIDALRRVEHWDVEVYVPGHGEPGGKKELAEFRQFLEWLVNEVQARLRQHKSMEQVKGDLVPFQNYHWHAPELASELVEAVYRQVAGGAARGSR